MIEDPSTLIHTVRISLDHLRFGMHRGYGSIGGLNRWSRHSILSRSQMGKSSVNGEFPARIWVGYRRLPEGTEGENYTNNSRDMMGRKKTLKKTLHIPNADSLFTFKIHLNLSNLMIHHQKAWGPNACGVLSQKLLALYLPWQPWVLGWSANDKCAPGNAHNVLQLVIYNVLTRTKARDGPSQHVYLANILIVPAAGGPICQRL